MILSKIKKTSIYSVLIFLLVGVAALLFHLNPDNFLADDAYFYPQVANQIVQGNGSTFHQYSLTNGYHPLWMVLNVILAYFANGSSIYLIHLLGIFQVVLFLITIYFLYKISQEVDLQFLSAGIAVLTVLMLAVGGLRLFEAHLAIALQMIACYLFVYFWKSPPSVLGCLGISCLLGMVFLARTDAFFFSASYGIAMGIRLLQLPEDKRVIRLFSLALPACGLAAGYMIFNKIVFGHPVPISGVIKSSYPAIHFDWKALGMQGSYLVSGTLFLLVLGSFISRLSSSLRALFMVGCASILMHALYILCFSWGSQWYYTTAFTFLPIAFQAVLTQLFIGSSESAWMKRVVKGSILLGLFCMVSIGYLKTYYHFSLSLWLAGKEKLQQHASKSPRLILVDAINQYLPENAGVAVFDTPGVLAYFSHARILPLDGLMNDRDYNTVLSEKGVLAYFQTHDIFYFLAPLLAEGEEYQSSTLTGRREGNFQIQTVHTPIRHEYAGTLVLRDSDIVFESLNPLPGTHGFSRVACWKIHF